LSLAGVSAASQHEPSTAISRRPRQNAPGVDGVASGRAVAANSTRNGSAPSRSRARNSDDFAGIRHDTPPTQVAQPFGQVPQHLQVGRRREQRQGQHEVDDQPRWQQPPTLLGPSARGHHPIHQVRWVHPGQHPEPGQL
jgi:hypothetical protein